MDDDVWGHVGTTCIHSIRSDEAFPHNLVFEYFLSD